MRSGLDINITHLDFADENLISLNLRYYFETKNQIMFKLKTKSVYNLLKNIVSVLIYVYSVENIIDSLRNINVSTDKVVFHNILYCIFFLYIFHRPANNMIFGFIRMIYLKLFIHVLL